jgi:hypothetical protein
MLTKLQRRPTLVRTTLAETSRTEGIADGKRVRTETLAIQFIVFAFSAGVMGFGRFSGLLGNTLSCSSAVMTTLSRCSLGRLVQFVSETKGSLVLYN